MRSLRDLATALGLAALVAGALLACSDGGASGPRRGGNGTSGSGGPGDPDAGTSGPAIEEQLFRALEPALVKTCGGGGGTCHVEGTYLGNPARFLAGPDAYVSVKTVSGIVTRDVYQSALLTKPAHAGPALDQASDLGKQVTTWLEAESVALKAKKLPTTDPISITNGANDVDLGKAVTPGKVVGSVHLKFDAALVGGILSLSNLRLVPAAGGAVHVLKPRFVKVRAGSKPAELVETPDPADSFSNADQTVAGGAETPLSPGSALFAGIGWTPFDLAADKIRIEIEKLEPGTITIIQPPKVCKNVPLFGTAVLPTIRATMAANGTCLSCHGAGTQPSIGGTDNDAICQNILQRLNEANIPQSRMITKVTQAGHPGGLVVDPAAWTALFVTNRAVFF
jgi:hypothetical protein